MMKKITSLLLFLSLAPAAHAAIIVDTSAVSGLTGVVGVSTWTHTVGVGLNGFIEVGCYEPAVSPVNIDSVTVGSQLMTFAVRTISNNEQSEIWYTTAPPTGAQTITVHSTKRQYCGSTSFFNVLQSTPIDISTGAASSSVTPSVTFVTTVSSDMLVDVLGEGVDGIATLVPAATQTRQWEQFSAGGSHTEAGSTKLTSAAGSQTMSWVGTSAVYPISVIAVEPSTGTPDIGSLSPAAVGINTGAFTLTVNGSNFVAGSTVSWNGVPRTTTFVSAAQLTIAITPADIISVASIPVLVTNPDGAPSTTATFNVTGDVTLVWATDGGYKPVRDTLYGTNNQSTVNATRIWNGTTVTPFQGKNELNGFALVLENNTVINSTGVSVGYPVFTGPNGYVLSSTPAVVSTLWDWRNRPIEVYLVRYLQIKGLTRTLWDTYDEQAVPPRMQATFSVAGTGQGVRTGGWTTRTDHDKYYPDPLVPMEAVTGSTFTVMASSSQAIWIDVYMPKTAPSGLYTATVPIYENGQLTHSVPISLTVYPVMMPDTPYAKPYAALVTSDMNLRHHGNAFPTYVGISDVNTQTHLHYYQARHQFGINPIGDTSQVCGTLIYNAPCPEYQLGLSGALYQNTTGYANAPGVGVPDYLYSMFTYGSWVSVNWQTNYTSTCQNANTWVSWFQANYPKTEYWWYIADEPNDLTLTNQYSTWVTTCTAPGNQLTPYVTAKHIPLCLSNAPNIKHMATAQALGDAPAALEATLRTYTSASSRTVTTYGGDEPWTGTMATEDEGIAMRVREWAHYKKHFDHSFVWEMNFWKNTVGGNVNTDVYNTALTFGFNSSPGNATYGDTSFNYANGDGVFFYPGHDTQYPASDYGADVPFPSWRLMEWRRGINDFSLLTMAAQYDSAQVDSIVQGLIPKVMWEYGVFDPADPTYQYGGHSWTSDPNAWELAREKLYKIIANHR